MGEINRNINLTDEEAEFIADRYDTELGWGDIYNDGGATISLYSSIINKIENHNYNFTDEEIKEIIGRLGIELDWGVDPENDEPINYIYGKHSGEIMQSIINKLKGDNQVIDVDYTEYDEDLNESLPNLQVSKVDSNAAYYRVALETGMEETDKLIREHFGCVHSLYSRRSMSYGNGFKFGDIFRRDTRLTTAAKKYNDVGPIYTRIIFRHVDYPELLLVCAYEKFLTTEQMFLNDFEDAGLPLELSGKRNKSSIISTTQTTDDTYEIDYDQFQEDVSMDYDNIDESILAGGTVTPAVFNKILDYYNRDSMVNVKAIKNNEKFVDYYWCARKLGWDELADKILYYAPAFLQSYFDRIDKQFNVNIRGKNMNGTNYTNTNTSQTQKPVPTVNKPTASEPTVKKPAEPGIEYVDYDLYNEDLNEAKYTKDELVDKFGTDDLDLINAGNEEDVELYAPEQSGLDDDYLEFEQEDEEPTAICPDCGEEMTFIGYQGYDEEFKCPVCGEYHYFRNEEPVEESLTEASYDGGSSYEWMIFVDVSGSWINDHITTGLGALQKKIGDLKHLNAKILYFASYVAENPENAGRGSRGEPVLATIKHEQPTNVAIITDSDIMDCKDDVTIPGRVVFIFRDSEVSKNLIDHLHGKQGIAEYGFYTSDGYNHKAGDIEDFGGSLNEAIDFNTIFNSSGFEQNVINKMSFLSNKIDGKVRRFIYEYIENKFDDLVFEIKDLETEGFSKKEIISVLADDIYEENQKLKYYVNDLAEFIYRTVKYIISNRNVSSKQDESLDEGIEVGQRYIDSVKGKKCKVVGIKDLNRGKYNSLGSFKDSDVVIEYDNDPSRNYTFSKGEFNVRFIKESLTEAKKTLDDLYSDTELEDIWNTKFNELVPEQGKAQTPIGEVMRCFARLSHAFLQNGDMLAKGYANRSTYRAADDMDYALVELGDKELINLFDNKLSSTRSENAYDHYLAQFYEIFVNKYLRDTTKQGLDAEPKTKQKSSDSGIEDINYELYDENLNEAKNDTLNPAIWDENNELKPEVKEKLEMIADKFISQLEAEEIPLDVKDVIIVGSNANYNYTSFSDIDLHIVADLSQFKDHEKELADKLYQAKKTIFNSKYDPIIKGFNVEIYVEPAEDKDMDNIPDEVEDPSESEEPVDIVNQDDTLLGEAIYPIGVGVDPTVETLVNKYKHLYGDKLDTVIKDIEAQYGVGTAEEVRDWIKEWHHEMAFQARDAENESLIESDIQSVFEPDYFEENDIDDFSLIDKIRDQVNTGTASKAAIDFLSEYDQEVADCGDEITALDNLDITCYDLAELAGIQIPA